MRRVLTALLIVCFVALPMTMSAAMGAVMPMDPAPADHHAAAPTAGVSGHAAGHCDENGKSDADMSMCCHMSAAHCGGVFQIADAWPGVSPAFSGAPGLPTPVIFALGRSVAADPPPPRG